MSSEAGFEDAVRRFLDHFEKISNCADEDVFLKEFMVRKEKSVCVSVLVSACTMNCLPLTPAKKESSTPTL